MKRNWLMSWNSRMSREAESKNMLKNTQVLNILINRNHGISQLISLYHVPLKMKSMVLMPRNYSKTV